MEGTISRNQSHLCSPRRSGSADTQNITLASKCPTAHQLHVSQPRSRMTAHDKQCKITLRTQLVHREAQQSESPIVASKAGWRTLHLSLFGIHDMRRSLANIRWSQSSDILGEDRLTQSQHVQLTNHPQRMKDIII
jgi:hypothetical protein